jgi:dynein heavy chain, axonemal
MFAQVCMAAKKEYDLETALNNMKTEWAAVNYEVLPYRTTGTYVISGVDDIISLLDDHLAKTQTMRTSSFIKPIEHVCKDWEFRLKYAQVSQMTILPQEISSSDQLC